MNKDLLSPLEGRILGCLMEKELTTPSAYPLSLNALVSACNQKSNRAPVTNTTSEEIDQALSLMVVKGFVANRSGAGRVVRWRHRMREQYNLSLAEQAVLAELLLRGAQQPGDLRSRAARMHQLPRLADLQEVLEALMGRQDPLVTRLPHRAGERASRYGQLLLASETPPRQATLERPGAPQEAGALEGRLAALEREVASIKQALADLMPHDGEQP